MKIRSLRLQDHQYENQWFDEVEHHWEYDDFVADSRWKQGWISMDCALYRPEDDRVYLGITCFDENHIFAAYDRGQDAFVDLGYRRVADPYDAKFHRSLVGASDGCLYASPALLHCPDKYLEAPGAAIIKYDPSADTLEKLGIPLPHVYVQSMVLDESRQTLYLLHFAPEYLGAYDLTTGESRVLAQLGTGYGGMAQGENIVLDDDGCAWSNWSLTRAWQDCPGPDGRAIVQIRPPRGPDGVLQDGPAASRRILRIRQGRSVFQFRRRFDLRQRRFRILVSGRSDKRTSRVPLQPRARPPKPPGRPRESRGWRRLWDLWSRREMRVDTRFLQEGHL